jgi:NADPH-dependent curcumin reductase CurA
MVNRQFVLAARPVGMAKESDFHMMEAAVPSPGEGEFLARSLYLSVDPYMRSRMNAGRSYTAGVEIGGLMVGAGVAEVIESKNKDFKPGDIVVMMTGWQEYAISNGKGVRKVDPGIAPISTALGVLGMTGLTAYIGLLEVCTVKPGETVVVSGAAGAVGSIVGQIAKIKGCRAVGIAGGPKKIEFIRKECGFDAGLDYKSSEDYAADLRTLCPNGIDAYFDNVGGPISDAVFPQLNTFARVAICGQIAQYNETQPSVGPRLLRHILVARARVQGFLIFDYENRTWAALEQMTQWFREGKIKGHEDVVEGFENMPRALIGLFTGENIGKRVVKIV